MSDREDLLFSPPPILVGGGERGRMRNFFSLYPPSSLSLLEGGRNSFLLPLL